MSAKFRENKHCKMEGTLTCVLCFLSYLEEVLCKCCDMLPPFCLIGWKTAGLRKKYVLCNV
jgi:hypothetical protein